MAEVAQLESDGRVLARATVSAGRIEIVLADGVRILVDRDVDADALARVIGAILRR